MFENYKLGKKIRSKLKKGLYNDVKEFINIELSKDFDFRDKKQVKKYQILKEMEDITELDQYFKIVSRKSSIDYNDELDDYPFNFDATLEDKIEIKKNDKETFLEIQSHLIDFLKTKDEKFSKLLSSLSNCILEDKQTLLLYGETGVGKSYLAEKIHNLSRRQEKPFVSFSCGGLNETSVVANIFGAKKGSFTGAINDIKGKIRTAEGGTLFVDEIDRAPRIVRDKLLVFLETKKFQPLGFENDLKADVRLLIGTNQDLIKLIENDQFEEDLYYRIAKRVFEIPPLRKRKNDIPHIIQWYLHNYNKRENQKLIIDKDAIKLFVEYNWPGNFRQLKDYLENIFDDVVLWGREIITADIIKVNPPLNILLKKNKNNLDIEPVLNACLNEWDSSKGKFLDDYITPMVAKIYLDDINDQLSKSEKYEQSMNILGISGDRRTDSTLHKQYLKYKEIKKKFS